jgi:outer membrane protein OmpA-like peptidoglycan-associated protein
MISGRWRLMDGEAELERRLEQIDEAVYEAMQGRAAPVNRSSATYIRWVQSSLNQILGTRLRVDGIMGDQTHSAIRSFQELQGLVADGIVGPQTQAELIAAGAPPLASVPSVVPGGSPSVLPPTLSSLRPYVVLDRFEFDQSSLTPLHLRMISRIAIHVVASWRATQPIHTIRLVGHTDSCGPAQYNLALGQRGALAVQQALISAIERLRPGLTRLINFVLQSLGETRPAASSGTPAGRARSRRVEVFLAQRVRRRPSRPRPVPPRPAPQPLLRLNADQLVALGLLSPFTPRTTARTVANALAIMRNICRFHGIPLRVGFTILDHECHARGLDRGFRHPDGVMQTIAGTRAANINC